MEPSAVTGFWPLVVGVFAGLAKYPCGLPAVAPASRSRWRKEGNVTSWSGSPRELLGWLSPAEDKAAPERLYCRGRRALLDTGTRVAVVGSRRATAQGLDQAEVITRELIGREVIVVSGLALGIDTVAHRTAITGNGSTIAVLGSGVDQYATGRNRQLQDLIGAEHLLVSQFPSGTPPMRGNFPQRNKVMALVADATVIVEAAEASGTMHQGWEAIRLGRPVLFPRSLTNTSPPTWVQEMIEYGATVLEEGTLGRVLDDMPYRSIESLVF